MTEMGTAYPDIWNALAAKFHPKRVKKRQAGGGLMVKYINARTAMNRFDAVLGFENWWDDYERDPGGSENILCRLTIRLPDGSTVTKCDAGAPGNTNDAGDDDKGAFSDAFKRAAVRFGVGRYLYGDGVFTVKDDGEGEPAEVPAPATPAPAPAGPPPPIPPPAPAPAPAKFPRMVEPPPRKTSSHSASPKTGRELWAWAGDTGPLHDVDLRAFLVQVGEQSGYPHLVIKWNAAQVSRGLAAAVAHLDKVAAKGDAYEPEEALAN